LARHPYFHALKHVEVRVRLSEYTWELNLLSLPCNARSSAMGPSFEKSVPVFDTPGGARQSGTASAALIWALHGLAVLVVATAFWLAPKAIVLSVIAPAFILMGAAVAAYAWITRQPARGGGLSAWDLAGLYMFLGFVALGLANPDHVAALF
jgi:hypothetical protein